MTSKPKTLTSKIDNTKLQSEKKLNKTSVSTQIKKTTKFVGILTGLVAALTTFLIGFDKFISEIIKVIFGLQNFNTMPSYSNPSLPTSGISFISTVAIPLKTFTFALIVCVSVILPRIMYNQSITTSKRLGGFLPPLLLTIWAPITFIDIWWAIGFWLIIINLWLSYGCSQQIKDNRLYEEKFIYVSSWLGRSGPKKRKIKKTLLNGSQLKFDFWVISFIIIPINALILSTFGGISAFWSWTLSIIPSIFFLITSGILLRKSLVKEIIT